MTEPLTEWTCPGWCPVHGPVDEAEWVQHWEEPRHADDDGYRETYYCGLSMKTEAETSQTGLTIGVRQVEPCHQKLEHDVVLVRKDWAFGPGPMLQGDEELPRPDIRPLLRAEMVRLGCDEDMADDLLNLAAERGRLLKQHREAQPKPSPPFFGSSPPRFR